MFGRKGLGGETTRQGSGTSATSAAAIDTNDPTAHGSNRLVVGQGLAFNGAIDACTHLVVGGHVASDVQHCDRLEIAAGGSFRGTAAVNDADIAGQFEGELTVAGCLRIRETGRVKGRITYGTLLVESGGRLLGVTDSSAESRPQPRPIVVPLRPAGHTPGRGSQL
jgi:cytoskeletal protein CcmA (bactofilin family)